MNCIPYIIGRIKIEKPANSCLFNPNKCTLNIQIYDWQFPTVLPGRSRIQPVSASFTEEKLWAANPQLVEVAVEQKYLDGARSVTSQNVPKFRSYLQCITWTRMCCAICIWRWLKASLCSDGVAVLQLLNLIFRHSGREAVCCWRAKQTSSNKYV